VIAKTKLSPSIIPFLAADAPNRQLIVLPGRFAPACFKTNVRLIFSFSLLASAFHGQDDVGRRFSGLRPRCPEDAREHTIFVV
jgi:hypothetical protein